jgi:hypothetical protein
MLSANSYMFRHQDAILRDLIKTKGHKYNTYLRCESPSFLKLKFKIKNLNSILLELRNLQF